MVSGLSSCDGAEDFGDAPGLGGAAAWGEGWLGVKDFGDGADAGFCEMRLEADKKCGTLVASVGPGF